MLLPMYFFGTIFAKNYYCCSIKKYCPITSEKENKSLLYWLVDFYHSSDYTAHMVLFFYFYFKNLHNRQQRSYNNIVMGWWAVIKNLGSSSICDFSTIMASDTVLSVDSSAIPCRILSLWLIWVDSQLTPEKLTGLFVEHLLWLMNGCCSYYHFLIFFLCLYL